MSLHKSRKDALLVLALAALLILMGAPALLADDDDDDGDDQRGPENRCIVKFVCGTAEDTGRAVPGDYATAINILNPGTETVSYTKKLASTIPEDEEEPETPGGVTETIAGELGMMNAFDVDCREIFGEFGLGGPFAEGFLILESDGPLSVTAVYTAGSAETGTNSIDVEPVECDDDDGGDDDDGDD